MHGALAWIRTCEVSKELSQFVIWRAPKVEGKRDRETRYPPDFLNLIAFEHESAGQGKLRNVSPCCEEVPYERNVLWESRSKNR